MKIYDFLFNNLLSIVKRAIIYKITDQNPVRPPIMPFVLIKIKDKPETATILNFKNSILFLREYAIAVNITEKTPTISINLIYLFW